MMVGRERAFARAAGEGTDGAARLVVARSRHGRSRRRAVRGLGLEVRGGEIVGIAGVSGNGQRELAEAIAGLRPADRRLDRRRGHRARRAPTRRTCERPGLAYVPEERMRDGVVPAFSVAENLILIGNGAPPFARWGFLPRSRDPAAAPSARRGVRRQDAESGHAGAQPVRRQHPEAHPRARVVRAAPRASGSTADARRRRRRCRLHPRAPDGAARAGTAILIVSEDLDEVLTLSDRVLVMFEGESSLRRSRGKARARRSA